MICTADSCTIISSLPLAVHLLLAPPYLRLRRPLSRGCTSRAECQTRVMTEGHGLTVFV